MKDENSTCKCEDCDSAVYARGYCRKHYNRFWRKGKFDGKPRGGESGYTMVETDAIRSRMRERERAQHMYDHVVGLDNRVKWRSIINDLDEEIEAIRTRVAGRGKKKNDPEAEADAFPLSPPDGVAYAVFENQDGRPVIRVEARERGRWANGYEIRVREHEASPSMYYLEVFDSEDLVEMLCVTPETATKSVDSRSTFIGVTTLLGDMPVECVKVLDGGSDREQDSEKS